MKLSEAIRLGAMLKPQAFGALYGELAVVSPGDVLGLRAIATSCALGAAHDAGWRGTVPNITPCCPVCSGRSYAPAGPVAATVMHLNDGHRWTREQIADWVETIEQRTPVPAAVPVEARP